MKFNNSAIQYNDIRSLMNSGVLNKAYDPVLQPFSDCFDKVRWRSDKYFDAMMINDSEILEFAI